MNSLQIITSIPHTPKNAQSFRARIIEHAIITFLIQLRPSHPKLFHDVKAIEVLNRLFGENNGNISDQKEEHLDDIILLLYKTYPGFRHFHNHALPDEENHHIEYPMIHYRSKNNKAVITAFNQAIPIIEQWLGKADFKSWMSYKKIEHKEEISSEISITEEMHYYRLLDYLPLNTENYERWQKNILLKDRVTILEECLTGHLRRLAQTFIEKRKWDELRAELILIKKVKEVQVYHHNDIAFNILFRANILLPDSLAIGKAVSLGYGTQKLTRWQGEQENMTSHIQSELSAVGSGE